LVKMNPSQITSYQNSDSLPLVKVATSPKKRDKTDKREDKKEKPKDRVDESYPTAQVQRWLQKNEFDEKVQQALNGYNGTDVLSLTKSDARDLVGVKDGIRLYNRLHPSMTDVSDTSVRSRDPAEFYKGPLCRESGCGMPGRFECCAEGCGGAYCQTHIVKALVTGESYCSRCYDQASYLEAARQSVMDLSEKVWSLFSSEQGYSPSVAVYL